MAELDRQFRQNRLETRNVNEIKAEEYGEGYKAGHTAGYGVGYSDGKGTGYIDAKIRSRLALEAACAHLNLPRNQVDVLMRAQNNAVGKVE